jgi:hypothetical protein
MPNNFDPVRRNAEYEREWYNRCWRPVWRPLRAELNAKMSEVGDFKRKTKTQILVLCIAQILQGLALIILSLLTHSFMN